MSEYDLQDLENLVERASVIKGVDGGKPYIMLPDDHNVYDMEEYLTAPIRINRTINVQTAEAFIEYFQHWKQDESELFACLSRVDILGVIDSPVTGDVVQPSWCDHKVKYSCPFSRQWLAWRVIDRKPLDQTTFAEFLEDHVADVTQPEGGALLDLATSLQIHRKSTFGSSMRLATGEHAIQYSEENVTGTVEIPAMLELAMPVFERGTPYKIHARFKYRVREGDLKLWVEIIEPDKYVEDAFNEVVQQITDGTDRAPLRVTALPD